MDILVDIFRFHSNGPQSSDNHATELQLIETTPVGLNIGIKCHHSNMSHSTGPAHRSISNIRPSINPLGGSGTPSTPHTPLRQISNSFGSPSSLRAEEECVVIEIGCRYMHVGFAGDAGPKAVINFGPEEQRRAGDYRRWQPGYDKAWRERIHGKKWGEAHELWNLDLREVDLGLVGDKIERAIRDAYTKFVEALQVLVLG